MAVSVVQQKEEVAWTEWGGRSSCGSSRIQGTSHGVTGLAGGLDADAGGKSKIKNGAWVCAVWLE